MSQKFIHEDTRNSTKKARERPCPFRAVSCVFVSVARARPVEEALFVAETFAYHVAEQARRFRLRFGARREAALRLHLDADAILQKVSLSRFGVAPPLLFVAVYDCEQMVAGGDAWSLLRRLKSLDALVRVELAWVWGGHLPRVFQNPVRHLAVDLFELTGGGPHRDGDVFRAVAVEVADDRLTVLRVEDDRVPVRARDGVAYFRLLRRRGRGRRRRVLRRGRRGGRLLKPGRGRRLRDSLAVRVAGRSAGARKNCQ